MTVAPRDGAFQGVTDAPVRVARTMPDKFFVLARREQPEHVRTFTVAIDVRDTKSGARIKADSVTWEGLGRRGSTQRYGDDTHRTTLTAGDYVFRGYAKGYTVEMSKRSIRQSQTVTLRAARVPDRPDGPTMITLPVRVVASGNPVPGASVAVLDSSGKSVGNSMRTNSSGVARTTAMVVFQRGAPVTLSVKASGDHITPGGAVVRVSKGQQSVGATIQVRRLRTDEPPKSATLTVRTYQARGNQRPPVRATINVTGNGSRVAGGTTDGNGQFRTSLRPGTYHVTASASGFATGRAVVTVRSRPVTAQIALAGGDPDGGRPSHNGGRSPSSKHKRTPSSKQPPSTHQLKAFQLRPMKAASGPH